MATSKRRRRRPATTPEGREARLVSLAYDLAETQMIEGSASAQVQSLFLKLGSTRERLEQDRLLSENALLRAKVEAMQSGKRVEELYSDAMKAFRGYQGEEVDDFEEDEWDDGYYA